MSWRRIVSWLDENEENVYVNVGSIARRLGETVFLLIAYPISKLAGSVCTRTIVCLERNAGNFSFF